MQDNAGALSFSNNGSGLWTSNNGLWSFDQSTGQLALSAVPEPSAFAALAGLGALGLASQRRRRRA